MKILHTADLHLGVSSYGPLDKETGLSGRILDFLDTLDAMIEFASDNEADLFIIAGDVFHKHSPNPTLLGLFSERVMEISSHCPLVIIPGNHDLPGSIDRSSAVELYDTLKLPNVTIGYDYDVHEINTSGGDIQVVTFPFPVRSWFCRRSEPDHVYRSELRMLIEDLAVDVSSECPSIFVGHFSIDKAILGSERLFSFGKDSEISVDDLEGPWSYAALGHIHYYQRHGVGNVHIVYPGSPEIIDFGEEDDDKGFMWLELDNDSIEIERIGVDARPFRTIKFGFVEGEKRITDRIIRRIEKMDLEDHVVRLQVTLPESASRIIGVENISKFLYDKKGIYHLYGININVDRNARETRLGDRPVGTLSNSELLAIYFEDVGMKKKERSELMKLAKEIMNPDE